MIKMYFIPSPTALTVCCNCYFVPGVLNGLRSVHGLKMCCVSVCTSDCNIVECTMDASELTDSFSVYISQLDVRFPHGVNSADTLGVCMCYT
jgi:hypothetical protein